MGIGMDIDSLSMSMNNIKPDIVPAEQSTHNVQNAHNAKKSPETKIAQPSKKDASQNGSGETDKGNIYKESSVTENAIAKAVEAANRQLTGANRKLQCSVHDSTNRLMIKIINSDTNEVIREIPPEKTLDLFAKVLELAGLLVDEVK